MDQNKLGRGYLYKDDQKQGTGIIIRDCLGKVLVCQSFSCDFSSDPLLTKNEVLWRALQLCAELGFDRVRLEGDAKLVIDSVLNAEECNTWYGSIIEDIKHLLKVGHSGHLILSIEKEIL